MGIGKMAKFAWFPCTWVGEFGMLTKALEGAWTTMHAWGFMDIERWSYGYDGRISCGTSYLARFGTSRCLVFNFFCSNSSKALPISRMTRRVK